MIMNGMEDPLLRSLGEEVLKKAEQALTDYQPMLTLFYDSYSLRFLIGLLKEIEEVKVIVHGGYLEAERKRLELRPLYYLPPLDCNPVVILEICGESLLGREHFLQTILALGFYKGLFGDLLSIKKGLQLVLIPEIVDDLKKGLNKAYGGSITIKSIESLQLEKGEDGKEFPTTVASMRLDSIASAGFGTSRSRMKREIVMEKVKLNWRVEKDPARWIREDDVISMEGRGRLEIKDILGKSRRGRVKLLLKRYS